MKNDNLVDIRSRKSTVLVYISLAVFIVFKLWGRTTISYRLGAIEYNGITAAVMGLLILRLIIRDYKSLKWIIADVLVVAGAFSLTGMWGYNKELVTLALLIMASFGTSFYNLVKTSFISVAAMTGFVLCCYGLGFAENLRFIRIHDSDVFYVNSLGFDAYATLSYCAFILTTGYLFLRKASFKYWEIPIILVLDFFVFKITDNRLMFVSEVILFAIYVIVRLGRNAFVKNKVFAVCCAAIPGVITLISFITSYFFNPNANNFLNWLDDKLVGRLTFTRQAFDKYPLTFTGQGVKMTGNLPEGMEYTASNPKFFIDNGYLYYYFAYGVIALAVILFIYTVFIYRSAREGHYTLLAILITISIANFVNATMLYVDLFIPQVFVLGFLNYFISGFTKDKDVFYSREFKEIRNKSTGA